MNSNDYKKHLEMNQISTLNFKRLICRSINKTKQNLKTFI